MKTKVVKLSGRASRREHAALKPHIAFMSQHCCHTHPRQPLEAIALALETNAIVSKTTALAQETMGQALEGRAQALEVPCNFGRATRSILLWAPSDRKQSGEGRRPNGGFDLKPHFCHAHNRFVRVFFLWIPCLIPPARAARDADSASKPAELLATTIFMRTSCHATTGVASLLQYPWTDQREVIMKNVLALQKLTSTTEFEFAGAKSGASKGCGGGQSVLSLLLC